MHPGTWGHRTRRNLEETGGLRAQGSQLDGGASAPRAEGRGEQSVHTNSVQGLKRETGTSSSPDPGPRSGPCPGEGHP